MKFILALYYYEEYDKVIEKVMFLWGVYGAGMLKINTHDFIEEIF